MNVEPIASAISTPACSRAVFDMKPTGMLLVEKGIFVVVFTAVLRYSVMSCRNVVMTICHDMTVYLVLAMPRLVDEAGFVHSLEHLGHGVGFLAHDAGNLGGRDGARLVGQGLDNTPLLAG